MGSLDVVQLLGTKELINRYLKGGQHPLLPCFWVTMPSHKVRVGSQCNTGRHSPNLPLRTYRCGASVSTARRGRRRCGKHIIETWPICGTSRPSKSIAYCNQAATTPKGTANASTRLFFVPDTSPALAFCACSDSFSSTCGSSTSISCRTRYSSSGSRRRASRFALDPTNQHSKKS